MAGKVERMKPHVIITGNVVTGIEVHGPFPNLREAITWGQTSLHAEAEWQFIECTPQKNATNPKPREPDHE